MVKVGGQSGIGGHRRQRYRSHRKEWAKKRVVMWVCVALARGYHANVSRLCYVSHGKCLWMGNATKKQEYRPNMYLICGVHWCVLFCVVVWAFLLYPNFENTRIDENCNIGP